MATETIDSVDLATTARERYLRYAMSVITSRALPDIRDGLKPGQRRILYAMLHDLHLRPVNRPVKSSKVVGHVMGNYHPHGDQSIYDTMVRMAQPFALRYPLVDGQGNFGGISGDNAAAARYTEARLRELGAELMLTIGEETVDTRPTYDETGTEPVVLPTPLPMLLLNGAAGIAVGMATNMPPHNLSEVVKATVALIGKPNLSVAQLMRSLKGPDFPTGGELLATRDELRQIYENGSGTIKLRATWHVETPEREKRQRFDRKTIVIDSTPYGVSTGQIVAKIREVIDGKKLPQIANVSDQTTEKVRIVIELRASEIDVDPELIVAALFRMTPLRISYGINLTCLLPMKGAQVALPKRHIDLKAMLQAWLEFRFTTVTRSIEFRKRRLEQRIHILLGLHKVLNALSEAIKLIRASRDKTHACEKLRKRFKLSELQANAVLEIQLYRLAQLEVKKIKDELAEKKKERDRLGRLLKGNQPRWSLIKKELLALDKRFGDARRTKLILSGDEQALTYDPNALIRKEDTHVVLTRAGRLKRQRTLESLDKVRLRDDDAVFAVLQGSTLANVVFFTNCGAAYVIQINDIPATTGYGEPIQKFFNFKDGERVINAVSLDQRMLEKPEGKLLLVATASGNLVRVPFDPHLEVSTRSGRKFVRLVAGDEAVAAELPEKGARHVVLLTNKGYGLRCRLSEVAAIAGVGKGKRGIRLKKKKKELLVGASSRAVIKAETTRGGTMKIKVKDLDIAPVGDEGQELIRFGFRRIVQPDTVLYDLLEE